MKLPGIKYVLKVPAHFWIALFVFVIGFITRQDVLQSNRISGLNESVKARLCEYSKFFSCLSGLSEQNQQAGLISLYSNRRLYCANGKLIPLGTIGIQNPLTPRKHEYPKNPRDVSLRLLKENIGKAFASCAYEDSGYINEPVVDIYYPFLDKNGCMLYYYTTVLVRDLLIYAPKYNDIRLSHPSPEKTDLQTVRLESLNVYVAGTVDDGMGLWFSIIFFLAYAAFAVILNFKKYAKRLENLYEEHQSMTVLACESKKSLGYLHKIIKNGENFICTAAADIIVPKSIISETAELLSSEISEKKMKVYSKSANTGLTFPGSEFEWRLLLGAILETLIRGSPPETRITYDILTEEHAFIRIVFEDDTAISLNTAQNLFLQDNRLTYFPSCDFQRLVDHMGIYINISASKDGGNLLMIAVPLKQEQSPEVQADDTNVLVFSR